VKKNISIMGSGPSALMFAAVLDGQRFDIHLYDKNHSPGRKFLVAGQGGFNLTHSEAVEQMISRYSPAPFFENLLTAFSNKDLMKWLEETGIPTYTGSSKRVFPLKGMKPIEVLNAFLERLRSNNVQLHMEHTWEGWSSSGELLFHHEGNVKQVPFAVAVFALGGGSWKVTGSDGSWTRLFHEKGIDLIPFEASNCAFAISWSQDLLNTTEGKALKNISIRCGQHHKKGELIITRFGLEGGAIYALSPQIREELRRDGKAKIYLDLKPGLDDMDVLSRISNNRGSKSWSAQIAEKLNLDTIQMNLLKNSLSKEDYMNKEKLSHSVKNLELEIQGMASVDEAISTSGGIALHELDEHFQLCKLRNHYALGEMLDWDAPTGGYLLQACFSMGNQLGRYLNEQPETSNGEK
jgi:uncharacterized flavoprotein (TIGR03862 family)